jgi:transposase
LKYLIVLFLLLTSALAEGQADQEPAPQARKSGLSVGGQFRHSGATLRQVAQPDDIIIHAPEACHQCHASLDHTQPQHIIRRQVFDIEDGRVKVTEHRTEARLCSKCATLTLLRAKG